MGADTKPNRTHTTRRAKLGFVCQRLTNMLKRNSPRSPASARVHLVVISWRPPLFSCLQKINQNVAASHEPNKKRAQRKTHQGHTRTRGTSSSTYILLHALRYIEVLPAWVEYSRRLKASQQKNDKPPPSQLGPEQNTNTAVPSLTRGSRFVSSFDFVILKNKKCARSLCSGTVRKGGFVCLQP